MYNTCTNLNSLPLGLQCSPMIDNTVYVHNQGFAETVISQTLNKLDSQLLCCVCVCVLNQQTQAQVCLAQKELLLTVAIRGFPKFLLGSHPYSAFLWKSTCVE